MSSSSVLLSYPVRWGVKFNPNHVPAGSSEGGEFAPADGGAGSGTDKPGSGGHITGLHYDKDKKKWLDADGNPVSQEIADRIKAAGVKPAYTDVALNPDPTAALQATGKDAKGRTQYMYSKAHAEAAAAEKFARLRDFNNAVPALRASIAADMADKGLSQGARDQAAVLSLIDHTGIRVGSAEETGADVKAYGATTLLGEHVTLGANGRVDLSFPGKSGVMNKATFNSPELHAYIASKNPTAGQRVFETNAPAVREYLNKIGQDKFSPKDFRTYLGTSTALQEIAGKPIPSNAREYAKQRLEVARVVSARLNNTPTVALAAYIDPAVFRVWGKGGKP